MRQSIILKQQGWPAWVLCCLAFILLAACQESEESRPPATPGGFDQPASLPTSVLPATFTAPAPDPTTDLEAGSQMACREDAECILVVRTDSCCSCPEIMSRAALLTDETLVLYEPGQSYGDLLPDACANVACETCLPPPSPICSSDGQCRAQSSAESILQDCPSCFEQAAMATYENGDMGGAINFCYQTDTDACLLSLFSIAVSKGDLESGLQLCADPAHPDPGGCLATLAPEIAVEDSERAVTLCQQITATDVRQFGCMLDVAIAVHALNPDGGQAICRQLEGERVGQCLEELGG